MKKDNERELFFENDTYKERVGDKVCDCGMPINSQNNECFDCLMNKVNVDNFRELEF